MRRILRTLALYSAVVLGCASERRAVRPDGARQDGAAARRRVRAARALLGQDAAARRNARAPCRGRRGLASRAARRRPTPPPPPASRRRPAAARHAKRSTRAAPARPAPAATTVRARWSLRSDDAPGSDEEVGEERARTNRRERRRRRRARSLVSRYRESVAPTPTLIVAERCWWGRDEAAVPARALLLIGGTAHRDRNPRPQLVRCLCAWAPVARVLRPRRLNRRLGSDVPSFLTPRTRPAPR